MPEPRDASILQSDLPCATCGYNLRTLAEDGVCPECGTKNAESRERSGFRIPFGKYSRTALVLRLVIASAVLRLVTYLYWAVLNQWGWSTARATLGSDVMRAIWFGTELTRAAYVVVDIVAAGLVVRKQVQQAYSARDRRAITVVVAGSIGLVIEIALFVRGRVAPGTPIGPVYWRLWPMACICSWIPVIFVSTRLLQLIKSGSLRRLWLAWLIATIFLFLDGLVEAATCSIHLVQEAVSVFIVLPQAEWDAVSAAIYPFYAMWFKYVVLECLVWVIVAALLYLRSLRNWTRIEAESCFSGSQLPIAGSSTDASHHE